MDLTRKILKDLKVELTEKFDGNFSRGGFFGDKWLPAKLSGRPSHLIKTGTMRSSIKSTIRGHSIIFTSSTPYAAIHNYGGNIIVTKKMKGHFWAMYSKTHVRMIKALALKKVGSIIKIPQRKFIGNYSGLDKTIDRTVKHVMEDAINDIIKNSK